VLPDPEAKPGEAAWALNVGVAARWVLGRCGISATAKMQREVVIPQLALKVGVNGNPLWDAALLMALAWEAYQARVSAGQLRFQWGAAAFFGEGYWDRANVWPFKDQAPGVPARTASVGMYQEKPEQAAEREAAAREKTAAWVEANAGLIEKLDVPEGARAALVVVVNDMRGAAQELRDGGMGYEAVDAWLQEIERGMLEALVETVPAAKAAWKSVDERIAASATAVPEEQVWRMRRARVCNAIDAPYLGLRFMPG
jgi:hypothetical protein